MPFLEKFTGFLLHASLVELLTVIFLINLFQLLFVVLFGGWLVRQFAHRRISEPPGPLKFREGLLVLTTLLVNTGITYLGFLLWQRGYIVIQNGSVFSMLIDTVVFVLFIDLCMYALHRVAHLRTLFPWLHGTHHEYEDPRPITLFLLNPVETISFGFLWLLILMLYPSSWTGIVLFMTFNLVFGMIGHLGVEPLPEGNFRTYFVRVFSTSTFHAQHHKTDRYNFGFYLVLWDKYLKTLHPDYFLSFKNKTSIEKEARKKLAKALWELQLFYIEHGEPKTPMTISLDDLARMAALDKETTEKITVQFIEEKLIRIEKSAVVLLEKRKIKKLS